MQLSDFDYQLPEELIARFPLANRSDSRLLTLSNNKIFDNQFTDIPKLLTAGDLIVFNDTKVIKARLFGQKTSGGKVEVLVERLQKSTIALCHVRASKAPKAGAQLILADKAITVEVIGRQDNLFIIDFQQPILPLLDEYGELPIPPYFDRQATQQDDERYQTVFHNPEKSASVAAPTASLHFDDDILKKLTDEGIQHCFVTLHVGAGTFAPVKTDNILEHKMHSEYAELSKETAEKINQTRKNGGNIIAVGTTVTRVLETVAKELDSSLLQAWSGDTDIFIYPGFQFRIIDKLITNFHLPKSTLLMLVSAFAGTEVMKTAYQHAIQKQYRFFSYGDAMLLEKSNKK